ncbi:MAG: hypothetical protein ACR2PL_20340 [Dehalococcoidia bacterium]
MQTYTTRDHRILDLSGLNEEQQSFFDRCYAAYTAGLPWLDLLRLLDGPANSLLSATDGQITRSAWDTPLFQAVQDLADRAGIRQGRLAPGSGDDLRGDPLDDARSHPSPLPAERV